MVTKFDLNNVKKCLLSDIQKLIRKEHVDIKPFRISCNASQLKLEAKKWVYKLYLLYFNFFFLFINRYLLTMSFVYGDGWRMCWCGGRSSCQMHYNSHWTSCMSRINKRWRYKRFVFFFKLQFKSLVPIHTLFDQIQ